MVKTKQKKATKKAAAPSAAAKPPASPSDNASAKRFKRDLLVRGEAAFADESGKLPSEATHEIVPGKKDDDGLPQVKRRLFKLY